MNNNYIITKYYEEHKDYCLVFTCGADRATAEVKLTQCQKNEPDAKFRIEEVEAKDCWWNQGWLD